MEPRRAAAPTLKVNGFVVADNNWCGFCSPARASLAVPRVRGSGGSEGPGRSSSHPRDGAYVEPAELGARTASGRGGTRIVTLGAICVEIADLPRMLAASGPTRPRLRILARALRPSAPTNGEVNELAVAGLALELVETGSERQHADEPRVLPPISSVDEFVAANYLGRIRVEQLGALVHVHPAHLARVFRAHHGETIGRRIRRLRLEWARGMLVESDEPLREIAVGAGFAHQSHFTRVFKEATGSSPARYRELHRHG